MDHMADGSHTRYHWNPSIDTRFGSKNLAGRSRKGSVSITERTREQEYLHATFTANINQKIFKQTKQSPTRSIPHSPPTKPFSSQAEAAVEENPNSNQPQPQPQPQSQRRRVNSIAVAESDARVASAIRTTRLQCASTEQSLKRQVELLRQRLYMSETRTQEETEHVLNRLREQEEELQEARKNIAMLSNQLKDNNDLPDRIQAQSAKLHAAANTIQKLSDRLEQTENHRGTEIEAEKKRYIKLSLEFESFRTLSTQEKTRTNRALKNSAERLSEQQKKMENLVAQNKNLAAELDIAKTFTKEVVKQRIEAAKVFRKMNNAEEEKQKMDVPLLLDQQPLPLVTTMTTTMTPSAPSTAPSVAPSAALSVAPSTMKIIPSTTTAITETTTAITTLTEDQQTLEQPSNSTAIVTKRTAFSVKFKGSLGVQIGDQGIIEEVNVDSAAADAGVQIGDTIAFIDGVPLSHMFAHTDSPNAREVGAALNRSKRQQGYVSIRFRPGK